MKTTKFFVLATAAALTVGGFTAGNLPAQVGGPPGRGGAGGIGAIGAKIAEKLALTDEQQARIKSELALEKDVVTDLARKLYEAKKGLREILHQTDASEAKVREAATKVGTVETDLAVERFKIYGRLRPILTADQIEKLNEMEETGEAALASAIEKIGQHVGP